MIKGTVLLAMLVVPCCGHPRNETAPNIDRSTATIDMSGSRNDKSRCASREKVLAIVSEAALSGEVERLADFTVTTQDLLKLQNLNATSKERRTALDQQMRADVVNAVKKFRESTKPLRVVKIVPGEFREGAPIENITPAVDQIRDAQIVFDTAAGEKALVIGVLVRIGQCWKILYV